MENRKNYKTIVPLLGICFLGIFCNFVFGILNLSAQEKFSSDELITRAWEAHGKGDVEATFKYTDECINTYKNEADSMESSLKELPQGKNDIEAVQALNDVATAYFIQGESYRNQGKKEEAIKAFKTVIEKYPYGQAWDQRGWFWQVAKTAKESLAQLGGGEVRPPETKPAVSQSPTKVVLYDPGMQEFIDYTKYGEFTNGDTKDYKYIIKDQEGLSTAVGENF